MIAARQRTFRTDEPPVLFRLPDLRKRTNSDDASVASSGASSAESTLRVDSPQPLGSHVHHEPQRSLEVAARTSEASFVASGSTVDLDENSSAKSWMERVGSRLILLVTLVVIVSAAWITGRQMPASKPGSGVGTELTQVEERDDASQENGRDSVAKADESLPATPATDFSSMDGTGTLQEPQHVAATTEASSVTAALKPVISPVAAPTSNAASRQEPGKTPGTVFNTVSMQSSSPLSGGSTQDANDPGVIHDLNPPVTTSPLSAATSPSLANPANQTGGSVATSAPALNAASKSIQTSTPNELTLDPAVLVPWVLEQTTPAKPVPSATPNPVVDWERYLPSAGGAVDSSVRAVSATQPIDTVMPAQQASFPAGVTANPYSR